MAQRRAGCQHRLHEAQPVVCLLSVRSAMHGIRGPDAGSCVEEVKSTRRGISLLNVRRGSGTSNGRPLSRSPKVNWFSSLVRKWNMLRQLLTLRSLPYLAASHAIFSRFPDESLRDAAGTFAGESKVEDGLDPAARLPMLWERRGRLAARTVSEYMSHSMGWKNMVVSATGYYL